MHLLHALMISSPVCHRLPPFERTQAAFVGAVAIAELVKSTLGPKGMVSLLLWLSHRVFALGTRTGWLMEQCTS